MFSHICALVCLMCDFCMLSLMKFFWHSGLVLISRCQDYNVIIHKYTWFSTSLLDNVITEALGFGTHCQGFHSFTCTVCTWHIYAWMEWTILVFAFLLLSQGWSSFTNPEKWQAILALLLLILLLPVLWFTTVVCSVCCVVPSRWSKFHERCVNLPVSTGSRGWHL